MSMIQSDLLLGQEGGAGYTISRSLRFSSIDSAFLSRTPASAGNRKTWTWAGWVKRSAIADSQRFFGTLNSGGTLGGHLQFTAAGELRFVDYTSGGTYSLVSSSLYRDPSAWYHIVCAFDTTQATASNRIKLYVNNVLLTAFSTANYHPQNTDGELNNATTHGIGRAGDFANDYFTGYLADVHFIDGQALTPPSFTEVSATTGQLIPKAYTGTFTGNSFWLKFADNSAATATTLGKDSSGLGNNWTPNNLSVTAGAGNDSLTDTPTSYGTDTGAGGEVRGNYCTWNPLRDNRSGYNEAPRNGNLDTNPRGDFVGTLSLKSGKYYWEILIQAVTTSGQAYIGAVDYNQVSESGSRGWSTSQIAAMRDTGGFYGNGSTGTAVSYGQGDVLGFALDVDAGKLWIAKNGTWVNSGNPAAGTGHAFSGLAFNSYTPIASDANTGQVYVLNAGQRAWSYTAPSGFKALCDTNLPAPVVAKPSTVMDVKLYTGNDSTQSISLGFSPDFLWFKSRSTASQHALYDIIRGASKSLVSNSTASEATEGGGLATFDSAGFSLSGDNTIQGSTNGSGRSYVVWAWDAGSSTVTNTQGSITSQVRTNGYLSIVTFTGGGAGSTIGHGLGVAPQLIIVKDRGVSSDWCVYHVSTGGGNFTKLNSTSASAADTTMWGNTTPSSTTFTWGYGSGSNYVAYCFAPVNSYSAFGAYQGNGSTDGPFQWCGFRPRWIMIKNASSAGWDWSIRDTSRDPYNPTQQRLWANTSAAESTNDPYDILSNGFKLRISYGDFNASGNTYVWAAFAESPFQYARAR